MSTTSISQPSVWQLPDATATDHMTGSQDHVIEDMDDPLRRHIWGQVNIDLGMCMREMYAWRKGQRQRGKEWEFLTLVLK